MKYLIDTDTLSILQEEDDALYPIVVANALVHPIEDVVVCVVSFHEQVLGCQAYLGRARTRRELLHGYDLLNKTAQTYSRYVMLPFEDAVANCLDNLIRQRIRIGTMDLRIAATALAHNLIVVTRNTSDFGRVPGLIIEDWTV